MFIYPYLSIYLSTFISIHLHTHIHNIVQLYPLAESRGAMLCLAKRCVYMYGLAMRAEPATRKDGIKKKIGLTRM